MKILSKSSKFEQYKNNLVLYAAYWGIDSFYDALAQAASENDNKQVAIRARRMLLELPETPKCRWSGYYMLEELGKED